MRRVLAVLCLAVLFASCSGNGDSGSSTTDTVRRTSSTPTSTTEPEETTTSTTATPVPIDGGLVVIADDQEPPTLNPFAPGGDNFIVSIIGQAHLAGVYDIDGTTLELIPELVTQLPTVGNGGVVLNEDGTMTVRYEIRDEAVWSDGVPIMGVDLAYTLDVMLDSEISGERWSHLDIVDTVADGKTLALTFAGPTLAFETLFTYVIPRHAVADSDFLNDWNTEMWPAAGPFVVSEWVQGEYLRLIRNERYWKTDPGTGEQLPYLDAVEFRFIPETDSLIYAFTQREVDVIQPPPSADIIERLEVLESAGAEVQLEPGVVWEHLNFQFGPNNRNPETMNQYAPFRQAVAYALDPNLMAPQVGWLPIYSIYSFGEEGPWTQYRRDQDRARDLIAEACELAERDCETNPPVMIFSTTSNADERPRMANHLQAELAKIGVEVELQLEDSQLYFGETLDNGTWDVGWWAWVRNPGAGGAVGLLDLFDPDAPPPDGANYYRWGTPDSSVHGDAVDRFREVLDLAKSSFDPSQVLTLSKAAEQILADEAVVLPIGARPVLGAVWADKLVGYDMNPTQASHTWNIEFWRRLDTPQISR